MGDLGVGDLVRYVPPNPGDAGPEDPGGGGPEDAGDGGPEDAGDGGEDLGVGVVRRAASFGWLVDFVDTVGLLWCAEEELQLELVGAAPGEWAPAATPVLTLLPGPATGTLPGRPARTS